jgi:carboxylesterase
MRLHSLPRELAALPSTLPLLLPGSREGALLIHGYTGFPRELAELGQRLSASGLTVSIPRLAGHGTSSADFLQTGWRDWLRTAVDALAEIRVRCDTVHIVGHSMGGLLAVLLASRFQVGKLALIAPALHVSNPLLPLTPILKLVIRRVRMPIPTDRTIDDTETKIIAREYWSWRFPGQLASLFRLQRMALRALRQVDADTLVVLGGQDRTVPASVAALVERRIGASNVRRLVLENATHQVLAGEEGQRAIEAVADWLTPRGSTGTVRP